jgi:hypothetical protein
MQFAEEPRTGAPAEKELRTADACVYFKQLSNGSPP